VTPTMCRGGVAVSSWSHVTSPVSYAVSVHPLSCVSHVSGCSGSATSSSARIASIRRTEGDSSDPPQRVSTENLIWSA
jgi:hypothetical protein